MTTLPVDSSDDTQPRRRKRRGDRREEIIAAAIRLFSEQGYHATGIDDIGAAAGITGPAIYRHFRNKEQILETILRERGDAALAEAHEVVEKAANPTDALRGLVEIYVRAILDQPAMVAVAMFERRTLDAASRAGIERVQRLQMEEWVHALMHVRPDLDEAAARTMVQGALGLGFLAGIFRSGMDRARAEALIVEMIMQALSARADDPATSRRGTPRRRPTAKRTR